MSDKPQAAVVATATPSADKRSLSVAFTPRTGSTKAGARYLADAALLGCFGEHPIVIGGFTMTLDGRDVVVYMPGSQYRRDVRPVQVPLAQPIIVNGKPVAYQDDPAGAKAIDRLADSIRDAWATANGSGKDPFSGTWPLTL